MDITVTLVSSASYNNNNSEVLTIPIRSTRFLGTILCYGPAGCGKSSVSYPKRNVVAMDLSQLLFFRLRYDGWWFRLWYWHEESTVGFGYSLLVHFLWYQLGKSNVRIMGLCGSSNGVQCDRLSKLGWYHPADYGSSVWYDIQGMCSSTLSHRPSHLPRFPFWSSL